MRVLFVFPDLSSTVTHYTGALSYGVAALSAALRRSGHETALYHITEAPSEGEFRARVRAARPDLVAFSSNSHYARRLRDWTAWAREASGAPVAVGGVHATLATEEVAALPAVDFTCVGEGEQALGELCAALGSGADPSRIASLWVRDAGGVVRNPVRPIARDLDALPDPDLSLFAVDRLYDARRGIFTYAMSRGCAYGCTYCCVHALRDLAGRPRGYWRFLSPARAADQLADLIGRHLPGARRVSFVDAILFPDREWLATFAPLYRARVGLPFSCNLRADRVDEDTARLLRDMGCVVARMGVESGDEGITSEVLHRGLELGDIRRAFAVLRSHGIARWSYNMVGLPTETLRAALKTVRLNAEIEPDEALAFIFYPYPGTALRQRCAESGYLTDREFDTYKVGTAIHMPQFPESDILFVHRFFHALVRLHTHARRLPRRLRASGAAALDALIAGPLLPRAAIVRGLEGYRSVRHAVGEYLVRRSPALYRVLGGRDVVQDGAAAARGEARA